VEQLSSNPNIKVVDHVPYDKLFPLVKAIIHHGGIGTIAACLKSGKPFLTCPVLYPLGDQHFWGTLAFQKGVGLKPLPLKKVTKEKFIESIRKLLSDSNLYLNAKKIGEQVSNENGLAKAIEIIEKI
ncbi:MAG: glycosyltransferase, partial [Cyclobacteriaceae bacterium]|nr:glycosyltransferase [Cyclobacteriaceae bacterium]